MACARPGPVSAWSMVPDWSAGSGFRDQACPGCPRPGLSCCHAEGHVEQLSSDPEGRTPESGADDSQLMDEYAAIASWDLSGSGLCTAGR